MRAMPNRHIFNDREKFDHTKAHGQPRDMSDLSPRALPSGGPTRRKQIRFEQRKRSRFHPN
jgi:hypothetical protein